jgi:hypothetical protein
MSGLLTRRKLVVGGLATAAGASGLGAAVHFATPGFWGSEGH